MRYLLCAAVLALGCAPSQASFFAKEVKEQCSQADDPPALPSGVMDVKYSCSYVAAVELANRLSPLGNDDKLHIETSRISVRSVNVSVLNKDRVVASDVMTVAGFIDPVDPESPEDTGSAVVTSEILSPGVVGIIVGSGASDVLVRMTFNGRTLGGTDLSTQPLDFPVHVCSGCLCHEAASCTDPSPAGSCFVPQDIPFDCRSLGHSCSDQTVCAF